MVKCEYCGEEFKPAKRTRRFCSRRCSNLGAPRGNTRLPGTFYERNAERIKRERRERYATDPEYRRKVLARAAARRPNPSRPCEACGARKADRHHDDYAKPLEVRFLCRRCHIRHHARELGTWGEGLRAAN
jgi:hypothetical protein